MGTNLSSEIKTRFADAGVPAIAGRNAHLIGVEGVTERGPFGARLITSWAEYKRAYGGFTANADVAKAVWAYFAECGSGSKQLYINRIVHRTVGVVQSVAATINLLTSGAGTFLVDTLQVDGKTHGAYANSIKIRILAATNGDAEYFNLQVELSGVVIETWKNVTMDSTSTDYVETVINHATSGSDYITVTDLDTGLSPTLARPANGLSAYMASGDDGLSGLVDADYTGDRAGQYGIYAFDTVQTLDLLIIPARVTSAVQNAAITYCESDRDGKCFFIADPPASQTRDQMVTYFETTAALLGLSQKGAMYWPRVRISNPDTVIFGNGLTITVSPSGHLAGLCARVAAESTKGKFAQPAGKSHPLYSVVGFEGEDDNRLQPHAVCEKATRDVVFPKRINPLRKDPTGPYYVDGELTFKTGSGQDFPTVGEQLGAQYVAKEIDAALDVVRHMDNDEVTREQCRAVADLFLRDLTANGCFKSKDPTLAYTVDFGDGLNTPDVVKQYKLKGYVGLATNDPILYGDIMIAKDTRAYDASVTGQ
jgi:hypothetical protein